MSLAPASIERASKRGLTPTRSAKGPSWPRSGSSRALPSVVRLLVRASERDRDTMRYLARCLAPGVRALPATGRGAGTPRTNAL